MKKVFRLLTLFVVFGSMAALTSCGKDNQSQIIGKWQYEKASISASLSDPQIQEMVNAFIALQEEELNEELKSGMIEFKSDNTFVSYYNGEAEVTGTYSFENNKLIMVDPNEEGDLANEEFTVKTLTGSQMILESVELYDNEGVTGTITTTIEFKRV